MIPIQLYTVVFAAALAWMNRIPCEKMINYGASRKEEKEWHTVNSVVKLLYVGIVSALGSGSYLNFAIVYFLLLLISWVVFDCVLGKILHGNFFYIGTTAKTDKLLHKAFGDNSGLMKFLIACVLILFINFFL